MRNQPKLSPGQLYMLLKEEFDVRRPSACGRCRVPLPYAVARPDEVSANWRLGTPSTCPHRCDVVVSEVALLLAAKYDMADYHAEGDRALHGDETNGS